MFNDRARERLPIIAASVHKAFESTL